MYRIPLIKPYITDEVKSRVVEVLDSGYLTEGPVTRELEGAFRNYTGSQHAIAVSNCTVGLEMALRAVGVGPGDEVIVPDYTYPATASVVAIVGARIVLVDVDPRTMLIDYDKLEAAITPQTKAIMPVSLFGNPLDYDRLQAIKGKHGVIVIEDAACSIGASYGDRKVGNLADISVFSLHPRKFITTGEGGMVTTNHASWARWMESYKHFGMSAEAARDQVVFSMAGTNYKLSNIQAAVGVVQMRHVDELLTRRRELASSYHGKLSACHGVTLPKTTPMGVHSYQSFCVFVDRRDRVMTRMREHGVEVQIGSYALHLQPAFGQSRSCGLVGDMAASRKVFDSCLALPLYHDLSGEEQLCVVDALRAAIGVDESEART